MLAAVAIVTSSGLAQSPAPPWRTQLVPWETHAGQPRPWRTDARLAGRAPEDYPDDFQVVFPNPDSARGGLREIMWVRVIAHHAPSDQFLGILLNQPHHLTTVQQGDNVAFTIDRPEGFLVALGAPDYAAAGWPARTTSALSATLLEGIGAYRAGANGHNMPGIERCIAVLAPAVRSMPATIPADERFVAHFVLGRCQAEKYVTEDAVAQFRAAVALRPDDVDAHMALLAELSVMVHKRPGTLPADAEARWERDFVEQLAVVRRRFGSDREVTQVLAMVFDPSQEAEVDSTWRPHIARLRRVGYAVFRWKRR
jgi:hypothetical protein